MTNNTYYENHRETLKNRTNLQCNGADGRESYLLFLKTDIKKESNYTCQHCHKVFENNKLHVHHIIPSTVENNRIDVPDNLTCLCNSCHQQLHYLIKDAKSTDEILAITDKFMTGEIKSPKEKFIERSNKCKEFKKQLNKIKAQIPAITNQIKSAIAERDKLIASMRGKKTSYTKAEWVDYKYSVALINEYIGSLKDEKNCIIDRVNEFKANRDSFINS